MLFVLDILWLLYEYRIQALKLHTKYGICLKTAVVEGGGEYFPIEKGFYKKCNFTDVRPFKTVYFSLRIYFSRFCWAFLVVGPIEERTPLRLDWTSVVFSLPQVICRRTALSKPWRMPRTPWYQLLSLTL